MISPQFRGITLTIKRFLETQTEVFVLGSTGVLEHDREGDIDRTRLVSLHKSIAEVNLLGHPPMVEGDGHQHANRGPLSHRSIGVKHINISL